MICCTVAFTSPPAQKAYSTQKAYSLQNLVICMCNVWQAGCSRCHAGCFEAICMQQRQLMSYQYRISLASCAMQHLATSTLHNDCLYIVIVLPVSIDLKQDIHLQIEIQLVLACCEGCHITRALVVKICYRNSGAYHVLVQRIQGLGPEPPKSSLDMHNAMPLIRSSPVYLFSVTVPTPLLTADNTCISRGMQV